MSPPPEIPSLADEDYPAAAEGHPAILWGVPRRRRRRFLNKD